MFLSKNNLSIFTRKRNKAYFYWILFIIGFIKAYFGIYFWSIPTLAIAWFISFSHFFAAAFGLGLIIDGDIKRYELTENYLVQEAKVGVVRTNYPKFDIVQPKFVIFEETQHHVVYRIECDLLDLKGERINQDSVRIHFFYNGECGDVKLDFKLKKE